MPRPRFKIGDLVEPRPEWRKPPFDFVPSGRVRAIAPWGASFVLYVGEDHRAFIDDVFLLAPAPVRSRKNSARRQRAAPHFATRKR
jgi:hypothetical protein